MNFLNSFSNLSKNFFSIVSSVSSLFAITKLGADIDGEAGGDQSGWSVSINAVGDRVAIGANTNDGNGASSGHVRIYQWNGTAWTQLGADIDGEAAGDESGYSVSMNAVGDRVAIGAPYNDGGGTNSGSVRVYSWNGTSWTKLGQDIDGLGDYSDNNSGYSVSINGVGNRVVIGTPLYDKFSGFLERDKGYVAIYEYNGSSWIQLGANIETGGALEKSGSSVSINYAGNRIAIGTPVNQDGVIGRGRVGIYEYNGSSWIQLGSDIYGEDGSDLSGTSISINNAGDIVAIGAYLNNGNGSNSGHVRIYQWNGTAWTQLGADIDGEAADDSSGRSVSINAVGDRVAIGAPYNDGNGTNSGSIRIYSWNGTSWTKLATDIDGEAANDQSGWSVSMNAVGDKVAIGAPYNDVNSPFSDRGHARVYCIQDLRSKSWIQLGADIDGEAASDYSGSSVSVNAAGDRVAIGAPYNVGTLGGSGGYGSVRIYSWNGTSWTKLGQDIDGESFLDYSGSSVSMNAVGDRVAIGAPNNNGTSGSDRGHVRIYQWSGTAWTQMGADIDGEAASDYSGWSVSMNTVGDRVAIGAIANNGVNGVDSGHVRIYQWSGTAWTQMGADIDGEAASDQSGISVSINAVGDRVAIGANYNDGVNGVESGHVRIYSWNGTSWTKLGQDIDGEAAGDEFATSVSMNAVGDRVAIGANMNDGNGTNSGSVRVYFWNGTSWTKLGQDIDGEAIYDQSGMSVSMNAVGDIVAIGAKFNGPYSGHVRIYSWNGTTWTQLAGDIDGEAANDQSGTWVSISAAGDKVAIGAKYNDGVNGVDSGHVRIYQLK